MEKGINRPLYHFLLPEPLRSASAEGLLVTQIQSALQEVQDHPAGDHQTASQPESKPPRQFVGRFTAHDPPEELL
ncbi:hypothetical protein YIM1640_19150 [Thermus oshimai]